MKIMLLVFMLLFVGVSICMEDHSPIGDWSWLIDENYQKRDQETELLKEIFNDQVSHNELDWLNDQDVQKEDLVLKEIFANPVIQMRDCNNQTIIVDETLSAGEDGSKKRKTLDSTQERTETSPKKKVKDILYECFNNPATPDKFKCFECKSGFTCIRDTIRHHEIHKIKQLCKECDDLIKKRKIDKHKQFHEKSLSDDHKCYACYFGYITKQLAQQHLWKYHDKKNICKICNESVIGISEINIPHSHARFHDVSIPDNLKCLTCKIGFYEQNDQIKHLKEKHHIIKLNDEYHVIQEVLSDDFNNTCIPNERKCFECKLAFYDIYEMMRHRRDTHDLKHFCVICNEEVSIRLKHHGLFHEQSLSDEYKCYTCYSGYTSKDIANKHLRTQHDGKNICKICNQSVKRLTTINIPHSHARFHDVSIPDNLKCLICNIGFYEQNDQIKHLKEKHHIVELN